MRPWAQVAAGALRPLLDHAAATNSDRPILTAIEVEPASERAGPQAEPLVAAQPAETCPRRLLGDTAYGDQETRENLERYAVEMVAPVPTSGVVEGRLHKHDFRIDLEAGNVACTATHRHRPSGIARNERSHRSENPTPARERSTASGKVVSISSAVS